MRTILTILVLLSIAALVMGGQPERIKSATASTRCVKCLTERPKFLSAVVTTNVIVRGIDKPRGTMEGYNFKCRGCGHAWRRWEVLSPEPPAPPKPQAQRRK